MVRSLCSQLLTLTLQVFLSKISVVKLRFMIAGPKMQLGSIFLMKMRRNSGSDK
jgi:hypothetical protein